MVYPLVPDIESLSMAEDPHFDHENIHQQLDDLYRRIIELENSLRLIQDHEDCQDIECETCVNITRIQSEIEDLIDESAFIETIIDDGFFGQSDDDMEFIDEI